jgi:hypothetical protein
MFEIKFVMLMICKLITLCMILLRQEVVSDKDGNNVSAKSKFLEQVSV